MAGLPGVGVALGWNMPPFRQNTEPHWGMSRFPRRGLQEPELMTDQALAPDSPLTAGDSDRRVLPPTARHHNRSERLIFPPRPNAAADRVTNCS